MNAGDVVSGTDDQYGQMERRGDKTVVRFTRHFPQTPATVWRALTEPEHLEAWFPTTIEGERKAGAPLHFGFRDIEAPPFDGQMLTFDPPSLLEIRWGDQTLRFEVRAHHDGSLLVFTSTFDEIGKVARDGAGWHTCLDQFTNALEGRPTPASSDGWRERFEVYIERFGPEASTIGPPEEWERADGSGADSST